MIVRDPLELAYLREQDQRATDADARADVEQAEIDAGMAAHTIRDIIQRYGVEFVERVIQEWQRSQTPTCGQCLHFDDRGLCRKKRVKDFSPGATLTLLEPAQVNDSAENCPHFSDIGF
ncbi:MAG: hypothetical protein O3C67_02950 [Cyanobacteria bacterium]|nr:hypothetical protein [Cyanobacteriota bacterium]